MQTTTTLPGAVDAAIRGLGYELVGAERAPGGLVRVTIDFPYDEAQEAAGPRSVGVDDCEKVTRQLQHVLEVEGVDYQRLEVSSPGLDRPLRHQQDFERFEGELVEVTLKSPFQGRKHWRGRLERADDGWRIVLPPPGKPARARKGQAKVDARQAPTPGPDGPKVLDFVFAEVREARLVPTIDFKGRARRAAPFDPNAHEASGSQVTDGGRIQ